MPEVRDASPTMRCPKAVLTGLCLAAAVLAASAAAPAQAARAPYSAIAIDANTGAVLHNRAGDAVRYPASLTKMMTLYMTFELIELGRLDYDSKIKMTEEAAAAPPSKLDLAPGEEISVLDAVKALVTKSANDVAVALAQHIGGTEQNFARLMTRKARQIGMTKTVFKNASGLPDPEQVTTARDMLRLALRLQDEFPRQYKLFATRRFTFRGHTYRNHNALLTRYRGMDGIKTGYTRASGFNLVSSVRRHGKHVVAAVFGGRTARIRNARMRSLLNKALAKASTKVTRKPAHFVRPPQPMRARRAAPAPAKSAGKIVKASPAPAAADKTTATESARRDDAAPAIAIAVAKVRHVLIGPDMQTKPSSAEATARNEARPVEPPVESMGSSDATLPRFAPAASILQGRSVDTAKSSPNPGAPPSTLQAQAAALARTAPQRQAETDDGSRGASPARKEESETLGPFAIQIGAYNDSADARQHMAAARQRAGGLLDPYRAVAVPVRKGASQLYRARFRGFTATAAASTCLRLRRLQIDCFVVKAE